MRLADALVLILFCCMMVLSYITAWSTSSSSFSTRVIIVIAIANEIYIAPIQSPSDVLSQWWILNP